LRRGDGGRDENICLVGIAVGQVVTRRRGKSGKSLQIGKKGLVDRCKVRARRQCNFERSWINIFGSHKGQMRNSFDLIKLLDTGFTSALGGRRVRRCFEN
jgi:hypothetical protein